MGLLLTNGMLRMTLAAARSVGSRGIRVGVGETSLLAPAVFSKYCKDRWRYPDPVLHPDYFLQSLLDKLEGPAYTTYFPMDLPAIQIAMNHRQEIEASCNLPLPPDDSLRIAIDKGLATQVVHSAGIDAPRTEWPSSREEVMEASRRVGMPVVIKPRLSSGSRGIRIIASEEELLDAYDRVNAEFPRPLLQEYIPPGMRYDVCLLFDQEGEMQASFVQRELRHFPHPIGPSTMQESVWEPEMVERAMAIMRKLPWCGVAELEFMVDPRDGIPKFMEINPRFWNSLNLSIQSGVDFPWMLYQIANGNRVYPVHTYRIGERARSLIPGEALYFLTSKDRWRMDPPIWAGSKRSGKDDIWLISDPMPTIGLLAASGKHLFDRDMWRTLVNR